MKTKIGMTMLPKGANVALNDQSLHPRDVAKAFRRAVRKFGRADRINIAGTPRRHGRKTVVLATPRCYMGLLVLHLQHRVSRND